MRRLSLILMSFLLSLPVLAQYRNTDQLFASYSGREGYKTVVMGKKMLDMMQQENGGKSSAAENIRQIRILSTEMSDTTLISSAIALAERDFELISTTSEDNENTSFYINETNLAEKCFLMIAHREKEEVILEITGDFTITDISRLSKLGSAKK